MRGCAEPAFRTVLQRENEVASDLWAMLSAAQPALAQEDAQVQDLEEDEGLDEEEAAMPWHWQDQEEFSDDEVSAGEVSEEEEADP